MARSSISLFLACWMSFASSRNTAAASAFVVAPPGVVVHVGPSRVGFVGGTMEHQQRVRVRASPTLLEATTTRTDAAAHPSPSSKRKWGPLVTGAVAGWCLATQMASASMSSVALPPVVVSESISITGSSPSPSRTMLTTTLCEQQQLVSSSSLTSTITTSTTLLAGGAYIPDSSFESTDLSMPGYTQDTTGMSLSAAGENLSGGSSSSTRTTKIKNKELTEADLIKEKEVAASKEVKARADAAKEQAKAKAYYEVQKVKAAKKLDQEAIKEQVAADRLAAKETKSAAKK